MQNNIEFNLYDENLNEEEKSKLQTIISELEAKYNEIKDIQLKKSLALKKVNEPLALLGL